MTGPTSSRIISLAALTILDAGPTGQVRAAAAAGFTYCGLRLMPLLPTDQDIVGDRLREAELDAALAETGMALLEVGVFPLKPQMDWPKIDAVAAFASARGARHIVCPVEDPDAERRCATLVELANLCERHGLIACLEFNPYSACTTLGEAQRLLAATRQAGAPDRSLGLCLDVLHLSRSGGSPADLTPEIVAAIKLVHLCDASAPPPVGARSIDDLRAESRTARLLPGEGSLWLDDLIAALPADLPLSVEAPARAYARLPAAERAAAAFDATRRWLAGR